MGGCLLASLIPAALAAQESAALCQLLWGIDACGLRSAFKSTWFFHSVIPAQGSVRNFHSSLREISFMFARSKHTAHTFRSGGTIDTAVLIEVRSTRLDEKTESMSCSHLNKVKKCIACSRHRIQSHVCYELLNRYLLNICCFKVGFARGRAWLCHMQVYWSLQRLDTCSTWNEWKQTVIANNWQKIWKNSKERVIINGTLHRF